MRFHFDVSCPSVFQDDNPHSAMRFHAAPKILLTDSDALNVVQKNALKLATLSDFHKTPFTAWHLYVIAMQYLGSGVPLATQSSWTSICCR